MRKGLKGFAGTIVVPAPKLGAFSSTLDDNTMNKLIEEVRSNAHKLADASYSERISIVTHFELVMSPPLRRHVIEWTGYNRPILFQEFAELSMSRITTIANQLARSGKARDALEVEAANREISIRMRNDHDKEVKQRRGGSDSSYIGCSCLVQAQAGGPQ